MTTKDNRYLVDAYDMACMTAGEKASDFSFERIWQFMRR